MANPLKEKSQLADASDNPMISEQQALVTDANVAHALNPVFSDVEVETALNDLGTKINAVLDILEAHGLMSDS